jgi:hypothetical protein
MVVLLTLDDLVDHVITFVCGATRRETIELGVIHGFCIDFAERLAPNMIEPLSTVDGLRALVAALERRPHVTMPVGGDLARWGFRRDTVYGSPAAMLVRPRTARLH